MLYHRGRKHKEGCVVDAEQLTFSSEPLAGSLSAQFAQ